VIEDGIVQEGVGAAILELLSDLDLKLVFRLIGIPDRFIGHGGAKELKSRLGLGVVGIAAAIREIL
jgi:1-deoxy-D-xylulose-5-phosphate synthase